MSMGGSFLGGAGNRLLPAFVPFRFFLAAVGFHILAWVALLFSADDLAGFSGGPGPVLAAIHLLTLGVLATSAIGASYQLLPVVTGRALVRTWPARLSFVLLTPGILALSGGFLLVHPVTQMAGAVLVAAGLAVFAVLSGDNLRRAIGSLPVVAAGGWAALLALGGAVVAALYLIGDFQAGLLANHGGMAKTHMVLAVFGFMGLLVAAFSQILVPMFTLAAAPAARAGWLLLGVCATALAMFVAGAEYSGGALMTGAAVLGGGAALLYVWLMLKTLRAGMRKRLGVSFLLIRLSWVFLVLGIAVGVAVLAGLPVPEGGVLFGVFTLIGWLLTFVLGILQRIMPFLASMHVAGKGGLPPLLSEMAPQAPLWVHAACHILALGLVAAGVLAAAPWLIRAGAVVGMLGAVSFAVFAGFIVLRLLRA